MVLSPEPFLFLYQTDCRTVKFLFQFISNDPRNIEKGCDSQLNLYNNDENSLTLQPNGDRFNAAATEFAKVFVNLFFCKTILLR